MRKILSYCHPSFSQENVKGSSNYKVIKSGRSLDLAYQLGAMTMVGLFSFNVQAECTPTPDCTSIGYTETSCDGDFIKCPFDTSKLFCIPCDTSFKYDCVGDNFTGGTGFACGGKYVSCECNEGSVFKNGACACDDNCTVGAIYYSDGTCSACVDSNKTAIGVVVKDNELVISQIRSAVMQWGGWGYTSNIPDLANLDAADAKVDYKGKENTAIIVSFQTAEGKTASNSPAINCYEYSTEGTNAGDWYLPAAGELYEYIGIGGSNYNKINTTMSKLDWLFESRYFWSSSESDGSRVWGVVSGGNISGSNKGSNGSLSCFLAIN